MKPELVGPVSIEFKAVRRFLQRLRVAYLKPPLKGDQLNQYTEALLQYGFSNDQWDQVYHWIIGGRIRFNQRPCLKFPVLGKIADYANDLQREITVPEPEFKLIYVDGVLQAKRKFP